MLLWAFNQVEYDLYYRVVDLNGKQISTASASGNTSTYPAVYNYTNPSDPTDTAKVENYLIFSESASGTADKNGWFSLGKSSNVDGSETSASGRSAIKHFNNNGVTTIFPKLNKLSSKLNYEFAIHLTKIGDIPEFQNGKETWKNWNEQVVFHINVGAGRSNLLDSISNEKTAVYNTWTALEQQGLSNNGVKSIGRNYNEKPAPDTLEISWPFTDSRLPNFTGVQIKKEDLGPNSVKVQFNMSTAGTVYWAVGIADSGPNSTPEIITTRRADVKKEASTDQSKVNDGGLLAYAGTGDAYWIRLSDVEETDKRSLAPPDITKGESMQPWMAGTLETPPSGPLDPDDKPDRNSKDDPELHNLILAPDPLWVRNPTGENEIIHGEKYTEGRKTDFFEIDKLSADTNYFLYIVVKGSSDDPSHVYIYQFKTARGTPIISLGRYAESDTVGGAKIGTDIDSNLNYIVFSLENAKMIDLLKRPFTVGTTYGVKNTTTGKFSLPKNYEPQLGITGADGTTEVYTVLDALVQRYHHTEVANSPVGEGEQLVLPGGTYDGASVFDIFASDALKIELSGALHGEFLSDFLGGIQEKVPLTSITLKGTKNGGQIINEQLAIDRGTNYIILAVAQAPNKGDKENYEVDAYSAYTPIRIGSAKAPETSKDLWSVSMSGTSTDTTFKGTISITFDTPLYAQTGGQSPLQGTTGGELFKNMGTWTKDGIKDRLRVTTTSTHMNTTITLSNLDDAHGWENGDYILIPAGSMFNADSDPTQKNLAIRVTKASTGIQVEITWGTEIYSNIFPFEAEQNLRVIFEVAGSNPANKATLTGMEGSQALTIDAGTTSVSVRANVWNATPSYAWSTNSTLVTLSDASTSTVTITPKSGVSGSGTINLVLTTFDVNNQPKSTAVHLPFSIRGLSLVSAAGDATINGSGLDWTLSPDRNSVLLTLNCGASLPDTFNDNSISVTSTGCNITRSGGFSFTGGGVRDQIQFAIQVSGATAGTPGNLTINVDGLTLNLNITFTGSQSRINGGNIPTGPNPYST